MIPRKGRLQGSRSQIHQQANAHSAKLLRAKSCAESHEIHQYRRWLFHTRQETYRGSATDTVQGQTSPAVASCLGKSPECSGATTGIRMLKEYVRRQYRELRG